MNALPKSVALFCLLATAALTAAGEPDAGQLDEEALSGKRFRFRWESDTSGAVNGIATLGRDGTIDGISSPNESTWQIDGRGRLIFKHADGTVSTTFEKMQRRDGKLFFEGPFQLRAGIVHFLDEVDPDADARRDIELLNRLAGRYARQRIVCLDIGETCSHELRNGSIKTIRLVGARESRDSVVKLVRRADVEVEIDGRPLRLTCAPYVMPTEFDGLRIHADTTSGWSRLPGRVQFSLSDAADPIVDPKRFAFPLPEYRLFSHGTQAYNEPVFLGLGDGNPGGGRFYHDYGFDMAGYEGREPVASCTDGEVFLLKPATGRASSVFVRDTAGFIWHYGHLDSIADGVKPGARVRRGQVIGMLGKTGPSGNFSHLHVGTCLSEADARAGRSNRRLDLYPWLVAAYRQQHGERPLAVARPHQIVQTGEQVPLDGSRSIAGDAKIVAFRWELPDGKTVHGPRAETTFDEPGVYVASLWVKDAAGSEDVDFCRVKVFSADAPEDAIPTIFMTHTPTQDAVAGQPVSWRVWLQDRNPQPIRLDFSDGTVIEDYTSYDEVKHTFASPGIYVVTARATVDRMPVTQRRKVIVGGRAAE